VRRQGGIIALGGTSCALACSRATEPEADAQGKISFHFESASSALSARPGFDTAAAAPSIDSVVVHVFRAGTAIVHEVSKAAALSGGSVELTLDCIAESDKRVSVDLFNDGMFSHHGYKTDVDVVVDEKTQVAIDAYPFTVALLSVNPGIVVAPSSFSLSWNGSAAAEHYRVEASPTDDFATIDFEQSVTDTFLSVALPNGAHYFRIAPMTEYAAGQPCDWQFGYTRNGLNDVNITGFGAPAGIPGEVMTILGENLDYPGTEVWIGGNRMTVVSEAWGRIEARIPLPAVTETITVVNGLGSDTSDKPFIVQRVAYVTTGGSATAGYLAVLAEHDHDFAYSGVAVVPVAELDTRDMSVFDVIVVAHDTGTNLSNWGGRPARANAIANTNANVLAMGRGGAVFLHLTGATTEPYSVAPDPDGKYYFPDGTQAVVSTPHAIGAGLETFNDKTPPLTIHFEIPAADAGVNLYATRDCNRLIGCLEPTDEWVMADFRFQNPSDTPVVYGFWGYADDPTALTGKGKEFLGNMMYMLYKTRFVSSATASN
jgi:hypothetical protein